MERNYGEEVLGGVCNLASGCLRHLIAIETLAIRCFCFLVGQNDSSSLLGIGAVVSFDLPKYSSREGHLFPV